MAAVSAGQVHLGSARGAVMSVPTASLPGSLSGRAQATSPALGLRGGRLLAPHPRQTPLGSPSAWG
eukprot:8924553-Pyramimonas_sp.AAC.1